MKTGDRMKHSFSFSGGAFPPGQKTYVMGIMNLTPDSFYAGSRTNGYAAVQTAIQMEKDGADLLDVGACSTRPGGEVVSEEEELTRLKTALPEILKQTRLPVSVDTFRPAVARYALELGAAVVNDVSGVLNHDMADLVKTYGAGYVVMHAGPTGSRTADLPRYSGGIVSHVQGFFDETLAFLTGRGLDEAQICLDPGFGFAKSAQDNVTLLKNLSLLNTGGAFLLVALSRKRFIGALTGETDPANRLPGTLAADLYAALHGADMLRVHDVKAHRELLQVVDALK